MSSVVVRMRCGEKYVEGEIACDHLLIAPGPWSPDIFKALFPNAQCDLPIYADTGSYSMLLQSPPDTVNPGWRNKFVVLRSGSRHSLQLMMRDDGLLHAATVPPVTLDLGSATASGEIKRIGDDLRAFSRQEVHPLAPLCTSQPPTLPDPSLLWPPSPAHTLPLPASQSQAASSTARNSTLSPPEPATSPSSPSSPD